MTLTDQLGKGEGGWGGEGGRGGVGGGLGGEGGGVDKGVLFKGGLGWERGLRGAF